MRQNQTLTSTSIQLTHRLDLLLLPLRTLQLRRNLTVVANTVAGNTSVTGFLKLNGTDIRTTFAQNTYVNSTLANTNSRIDLINTNLTGTNTALRSLISDRLQVTNASATYQTKAVERAALANTNAYIAIES